MKKKKLDLEKLTSEEFQEKKDEYFEVLKTNPQYSLLVDPENKYNLTDEEKNFIGTYCEFKNIELAAMMSNITVDRAMALFSSYACQQEIRRINVAMYHQKFANKLLSIEELGGWLSSVLMDDVPASDRITTSEKIKVVEKILQIHEMLQEGIQSPRDIIEVNIEEQLKDLSVKSIKNLLKETNKKESNDDIIKEFEDFDIFTDEEIAYLKTLTSEELLSLLEETQKLKEEKV